MYYEDDRASASMAAHFENREWALRQQAMKEVDEQKKAQLMRAAEEACKLSDHYADKCATPYKGVS